MKTRELLFTQICVSLYCNSCIPALFSAYFFQWRNLQHSRYQGEWAPTISGRVHEFNFSSIPTVSSNYLGSNSLGNGGDFQGSILQPGEGSFVLNHSSLSGSVLYEGTSRVGSNLGGTDFGMVRNQEELNNIGSYVVSEYFNQLGAEDNKLLNEAAIACGLDLAIDHEGSIADPEGNYVVQKGRITKQKTYVICFEAIMQPSHCRKEAVISPKNAWIQNRRVGN
ncbi:hypothetical protein POTOM_041316 [Populus tomentosa]|uniref:Uncharacterized protein n=1 Tax=Populus tomentosa TaxID=118781 RepID=A0A8X7YST1_POPTO|nr:hypothetical protein POTOM_041316 [Populus tomentosa]